MTVQRAAAAKQRATVKPVQGVLRLGPRIEARPDSGLGAGGKIGGQQTRIRSSQSSLLSGLRSRLDAPPQRVVANNGTEAKRDLIDRYRTSAAPAIKPEGALNEEMTEQIDQSGTTPRLVRKFGKDAVYAVGGKNADELLPELEDAVFRFIEQNPAAWYPHDLNRKRLRKAAVYFARDKDNQISAFAVVQFAEKKRGPDNILVGYLSYFEGFHPGSSQVLWSILTDIEKVDPANKYNSIRAIDFRITPFDRATAALLSAKIGAAFKEQKIMNTPEFVHLQKAYDLARLDFLRELWLRHARDEDLIVRGWNGPTSRYPWPYNDERRKRFEFFQERANRIWGNRN